jgi:hypothetical protein
VQRGHARALDSTDVDERVVPAVGRRDEAESLAGIEKLDGAGSGHWYFLRFASPKRRRSAQGAGKEGNGVSDSQLS